MITDKIKFKPNFAKTDSLTYTAAAVEVRYVSPERLWRNLCNIAIWSRINPKIVDIQPLDPGDSDPHLFDKMQFNYDMSSGENMVAQVIYYLPPKDDRVGRLSYQATILINGKEVNQMVVELLVGVPDHNGEFSLDCAISFSNDEYKIQDYNVPETIKTVLNNLVAWSQKHH